MKDGLENIDKVFKEAFDGFEANVDPSVWANVQNAIGSGTAPIPKIDPVGSASVLGKATMLKIVAGVIAIGAIATVSYFVFDKPTESNKVIVAENVVNEDKEATVVANDKLKEVVLSENRIVLSDKDEKSVEIKSANEKIKKQQHNNVANIFIAEKNVKSQNKPDNVNPHKDTDKVEEEKKDIIISKTEEFKDLPLKENTAPKTVVKELKAYIKTDVSKGKAPLNIDFEIVGENIVSYAWDFGDGSETSNSSNPIHTFNKSGVYNVMLIVMDENSETKNIPYQIIVENNRLGFINQKAILRKFSPNGDGINDILKIEGENIDKFRAIIYSLNGDKVFEWNFLEGFWDGRDMLGNKVVKGTYMLQVISKDLDGKLLESIKQTVTVY